jgi:lipase chaperone LimK
MTARTNLIAAGTAAIGAVLLAFLLAGRAPAPQAPAAAPPDSFAFVRSMEGTRPDGDVKQDDTGQLVVDAELGHLFDYYLAGLGERDLQSIRLEIERELGRRLPATAAAKARRLLASYLDYKRALSDLEKALPASSDRARAAHARWDAMLKLRPRFFSDSEIAGLFGASDALDRDALARLDIMEDARLDGPQKAARLAALDKNMPAALRQEREAPARSSTPKRP